MHRDIARTEKPTNNPRPIAKKPPPSTRRFGASACVSADQPPGRKASGQLPPPFRRRRANRGGQYTSQFDSWTVSNNHAPRGRTVSCSVHWRLDEEVPRLRGDVVNDGLLARYHRVCRVCNIRLSRIALLTDRGSSRLHALRAVVCQQILHHSID